MVEEYNRRQYEIAAENVRKKKEAAEKLELMQKKKAAEASAMDKTVSTWRPEPPSMYAKRAVFSKKTAIMSGITGVIAYFGSFSMKVATVTFGILSDLSNPVEKNFEQLSTDVSNTGIKLKEGALKYGR